MLPKNITKEHIEKAIHEIGEKGIRPGRHSSTYDILFNNKKYPPKLIISIANRFANGEELPANSFKGGDGTEAFELLKELGFKIIEKQEGENLRETDPIKGIIEKYKVRIRQTRLEEELFKWQRAKQYRGGPNLDAKDFYQVIYKMDFSQMVYHNGIAVLRHLAKDKPEDLKAAFESLYDESIGLAERLKAFDKTTLEIYRAIDPGKQLSHHQDERSMSTYLAYYDANKYPFYKASFYKKYCNLLGVKPAKSGQRYLHYISLLNDLITNYIEPDTELFQLKKELLDETCHEDAKHLILAQDILYQMLDQTQKEDAENKVDQGEDIFIKALKQYRREDVVEYFDILDEMLSFLNINSSDERLVFGCKRRSHFSFIIGQRYCFDLLHKNVIWRFITLGKLENEQVIKSEPYKGKPVAYYSETLSPAIVRKYLNEINEANLAELQRTEKSGHLRHNNPFFEKAVFDETYRKDILDKVFGAKHNTMTHPLNQILFGPPGTGKTYSTIDKVVEILKPNSYQADNHKANKIQYEQLLKEGRVVFTTFHQSMTYEDFVEGIKPIMEENDDKEEVKYSIEDGIFKQMCVKASYEYIKLQKDDQASKKTLTFGQLYDRQINDFQERLDKGEEILIPLKGGGEIQVKEISAQGNFILQHQNGQRSYTVSKNRLEKLYNEIEDLNAIPNIYSYFRSIIGGSNASAYWAILNQLDLQIVEAISIPEASISYEDKRNAFLRIEWDAIGTEETVPEYVIVVDEINRGNIASILGELITLLETDKRGGNKESLKVKLPYSKKNFSVPPNLYIIGTMNTADRSVEALDTALRRRFSFIEMQPDPDLLEDIKFGGIEFSLLLTTINQRIEKLLNKDYMIGHAYFMALKDAKDKESRLKSIFADKVLPLLQEYFYGSFGKIQLVLGKQFVERANDNQVIFADSDFDGIDYQDREVYRIVDVSKRVFDIVKAVTSIYQPDEKQ